MNPAGAGIGYSHIFDVLTIPFVPALVHLASKADRGEQDSVLGSFDKQPSADYNGLGVDFNFELDPYSWSTITL